MLLRLLALAGALALACVAPAEAQSHRVLTACGAEQLRIGDGSTAFLDGNGSLCTVQVPFQRVGKAFALQATTTPQTYAIVQPLGSTSYRGINPCNVDIVIATVPATMPATTQPVTVSGQTVPNVLLVTSATGTVNQFEDTLFLARSGRVLGSSQNPMGGQVRYVSIMALSDPGTTPCLFRLGYGNNS